MLYAAYQAHSDMMGPVRMLAGMAARSFGHFGIGCPATAPCAISPRPMS